LEVKHNSGGTEIPESIDIAHKAVQAALDKQATDILMLDLRERCSFTDYFVVCCATSERQIKAIFEEIDKVLTQDGATLLRREGASESGWVLLDYGDIIVHVFSPERRNYYQLENLWAEATPVLRVQ